ncbi:phosphatase PAP2 family protein [Actinomyces slackii]|uniref:Phosphatidylglycerophosphatase B n=1 Tax=Actinomyces slackii TaxID=52774 RepID=A0A448KDV8_9ACTO|nr:phosphatase PAP2 family protein [Actinomyces slackii]VEG75088.1 phosphatidylglycerophosphatase B [Actinomyces slackii]
MISLDHLPDTWRTPRAVTLAVCAALLLGLFSWLAVTAPAGAGLAVFDSRVSAWAVSLRTPPVSAVMTAVSALCSTPGLSALTVVGVLALAWSGRRGQALVLAATMIGSSLMTVELKRFFGRERPSTATLLGEPEHTLSFPSGHSLNTAAFACVLAGIVLFSAARLMGRALAVVGAVGLAGLVGVSRVYLGHHWMTDVLAGWAFGAAWVCLVALAVLWLRGRRVPLGEHRGAGEHGGEHGGEAGPAEAEAAVGAVPRLDGAGAGPQE